MALQGIRVAARRSALLGACVVCALAFLNFVWSEADTLDSLRRAAGGDILLAQRLALAGRMEASPAEAQRTRLLVVLSLILCTVGIGNAMMMSVTERFRQIGTMKCLGALDSFIVRLFVLEGVIFGLAGGLLGGAAGALLAIARQFLQFGTPVWHDLPWLGLALHAGCTVLVGLGISLIGAAYPAIAAARMQPVEAMRVIP